MMRGHMDLLAGERFSVASYGIGAAYAAWLLREFGAEVRHTTALDPECVGAFLGQAAAFADGPPLEVEPGGTLITDVPVSAPAREQVEALSRLATVIWLTPWGAETSWSGRPSTELAQYAAGGWMTMVGRTEPRAARLAGSLGSSSRGCTRRLRH